METFSEDLIRRGIPFTNVMRWQEIMAAGATVAGWFNTPVGMPYLCLKRVRLVDGELSILLHNYVLPACCLGIETLDFRRLRLFGVVEEHLHLDVMRGRRTFQAIPADGQVAAHLTMQPVAPMMYIEQQSYRTDGAPVEVSNLWLRGDRLKFSSEVTV